MIFGWPVPLSRNVLRLLPGFQASWHWYELVLAITLSVGWIVAIVRLPFFQLRGAVHWALGVTLSWGLATTLWLGWFDYDKNYRPVTNEIARQIRQQGGGCVATEDAGDSQRASLYYFTGIKLVIDPSAGMRCPLLLAYSTGQRALPTHNEGWERVWQTQRGRGRLMERFGLYRNTDNQPATADQSAR